MQPLLHAIPIARTLQELCWGATVSFAGHRGLAPSAALPGRNESSMSTLTASVDLLPVPRSVPAARHIVAALLAGWDSRHDTDDVALLVTELVTNVIDHVGGEAALTLELAYSDGWLRIAVADGSSIRPVVQELSSERPRGRGLRLVQAIADQWGSEDHQGGKRIWFELRPADG
jgi:anti-sigma regulatory factor (Ser/Thr protein kinase)